MFHLSNCKISQKTLAGLVQNMLLVCRSQRVKMRMTLMMIFLLWFFKASAKKRQLTFQMDNLMKFLRMIIKPKAHLKLLRTVMME